MTAWREGEVTGDILEVPGIGPAARDLLASNEHGVDNVVETTWQLFGQYLKFKRIDKDGQYLDVKDHNDLFWYWLKAKGIKSHRSAIVKAIAEKTTSFFPGLYDANVYASDDEEDF